MAADLSKSIQQLAEASERLDANSEKLNGIILGLEEELRRIDPGVEVYLPARDDLIVVETRSMSLDVAQANGTVRRANIRGSEVVFRVGHQLGWARWSRGFSLVARRARENYLEAPGAEELVEDTDLQDGSTACVMLSAAPRTVRLAAVPKLRRIVDVLTARVASHSKEMEEALAMVEADGLIVRAPADSFDRGSSASPRRDDEAPF